VCRGGLTFKFDKNSIDIKCCIFGLGELGALFGGDKPTKSPLGDGTARKSLSEEKPAHVRTTLSAAKMTLRCFSE